MRKRHIFPVAFLLIVSMFVALPFRAFASSNLLQATPTPEPIQTWTATDTLTIAPGLSFVWLRATAAPNAEIRSTIYPGTLFKVQSSVAPAYDGYGQVWWLVQAPVLNRFGWVEQHSLVIVTPTATSVASPTAIASPTPDGSPIPAVTITPGGTGGLVTLPAPTGIAGTAVPGSRSTPQPWRVPNVLFVKSTVAYAWLRALPNSAAAVIDSVELGGLVIVAGDPVYDGTQWWWKVQSSYTGRIGWVEQDSIERAEYKTPTPGMSG